MKITQDNYIEQLKKHNENALFYVIERYGGLLKSIVLKRLRLLINYEEECMNDIFWGIWNNIEYFDESRSTFQNWAAGIARYKAIDYLRKYYKNIQYENIDDMDIPKEDEALSDVVEDEISDESDRMLACLNEADRRLFVKLYLEDKDMEQVSEETGLKKEVIYNRVSRGKKKIRKEFPQRREM